MSVGDLDIVKVVLEKRSGGTMRWMQVAIRPAKPFAFGTLEGSLTPVFGLPGNPVSAMVSFELFVRPGVRRIAGHHVLHRVVVPAVTECRPGPDVRREDPLRPAAAVRWTRTDGGDCDRWSDRTPTSCWPWPRPTPWLSSPTAGASPPGRPVAVLLTDPEVRASGQTIGGPPW